MVMMSYDILALHQREQVDERTLGDIFYQLDTLLPIIDLATAIGQLLGELTNLKVTKSPAKMTAQIKTLIDQFLNGLSIQTSALITLSMSNS
ncbi:transposase (plasmid) [Loigolactobacillus coryniformis subsp. torquens DSM 20004 = KCTC 3535]|uniref:Transposase n=1 Tax=Loigolactobacillus coryniformis subsp. torquens DSM 20004 = KCTC 3535 TaxID=1423822 RepID=A0A2D1KSM7_9LACO|nr:transposase [Loigolactobacillus coryniformis subsp. torquens DSM 20004 = KCTC 3535]